MVKIIDSRYSLIGGKIVENIAIAFDTHIRDVAPLQELQKRYPDAEVESFKNHLLMPGLINAHTHLEFSRNSTELEYGTFIGWLKSVIGNRDKLIGECDDSCIEGAINSILKSGTTTIGAVSSYGREFEALKNSPIRKVIFNELIGSQPNQVDALWNDFKSRVEESEKMADDRTTPAVAIHSPYSVHPILVKKGIQLAESKGLKVSTHFMESSAEREWLDRGTGDFFDFFKQFFPSAKPVNSADGFLSTFQKDSLFTHCNYISSDEVESLGEKRATVIHCPRSNRLLGGKQLDLKMLNDSGVRWIVATDGLSSNTSLSLWDELQIALYSNSFEESDRFALKLLQSVTEAPAEALGLNSGKIETGRNSDLIVIELLDSFSSQKTIPLHTIIKKYPVKKIFIGGDNLEL